MKLFFKTLLCLIMLIIPALFCYPLSISEEVQQKLTTTSKIVASPVIQNLEKLKGRAAGSNYEKKAASLLAREFAALNLSPIREGNHFYFQPFLIPKRVSYYERGRLKFKGQGHAKFQSQNVIGIIPGKLDKYLILSAHYDGQGINFHKVYPSANDNLSGIAALLSIAKNLRDHETNITYVFIAFGAEEMGLCGSEYFAQHLPFPKEKIIGAINIDTIGTNSGKMIIESNQKSTFVHTIQTKLLQYDLDVSLDIASRRTSDHYPLGSIGLNALSVMSVDWKNNNHTTKDSLDKVNFKQVDLVSRALSDAALSMGDTFLP
ncbi:DUF4910 domain-containing protein [Bacillota bacterium LX-D]|nr:DUF4910 domain-containing protein [Bacillota bacterium LX-D]